jgi:hypothetical protein
MPRVTINGGILALVISVPLIAPNPTPNKAVIRSTTGTGNPIRAICATRQPEKATTDPTDRSMPPVRITNVIPIPNNPMTEHCRIIFMIFPVDKK